MFENTRWSNPNYQPNFNYAERVEAARQGMPWYNIGSDIAQTIGRAGESVMQKLYTNEILKQLYGDNGGETEAAAQSAPAVTPSVVPAAPAAAQSAPAVTPSVVPAAPAAAPYVAPALPTPQPMVIAGGGGSQTEVGNPLLSSRVEPLTKQQYDDLVKKYYFNVQQNPVYDFSYGVV